MLWLEHHQFVSTQCKGGGRMVKGITKGVVWWRGENGLFGIQLGPLLGSALLGRHLGLK